MQPRGYGRGAQRGSEVVNKASRSGSRPPFGKHHSAWRCALSVLKREAAQHLGCSASPILPATEGLPPLTSKYGGKKMQLTLFCRPEPIAGRTSEAERFGGPQRDFVDRVYRRACVAQSGYCGPKGASLCQRGDRLGGRAGSIFLLLSGGQETGHKHDENSDQPQHLNGNAGDHSLRTSNNNDSVDVNNEQKIR
jgi:hypothetical protein